MAFHENGLCAMTEPTTLAVARNRAAVMAELRRLMPRMGEQRKALPFGLAAIDSHLPDGGLTCGALHEIVPAAESCIAAASLPLPLVGRGWGSGGSVKTSTPSRHLTTPTPPSPQGGGSSEPLRRVLIHYFSSRPLIACAHTARMDGCTVMASTRSVSIRPA